MARRQQFDTDQVLRAATQLFWRGGYKTTTIRDLVKATGVAESSLYHAFGGKRRLFEASLDRYRAAIRQAQRRMEDFDSPGEAVYEGARTLRKLIDLAANGPLLGPLLGPLIAKLIRTEALSVNRRGAVAATGDSDR